MPIIMEHENAKYEASHYITYSYALVQLACL